MNEYPKKRYILCSSSECKTCEYHIITQGTKTSYCLLCNAISDIKRNIIKQYEKQTKKESENTL